jgi:hypothetical protein
MALPSRQTIRDRWNATEPWNDNPTFFEDQQATYERLDKQFNADGRLTPGERRRLRRWRRRATVAGNMARQRAGGPGGGDIGAEPEFDQSAYDLMFNVLKDYGLESLGGRLKELVEGGVIDQASITLALQDSQEWKTRFAGNEALKNAGLPVYPVAQYLATEQAMAQVMKNAGVPQGFYDDPADFAKFIGASVSAAELQERVNAWSDLSRRQDPAITAQLKSMGMSDGDLLAFMMDPKRAAPLIQRKYQTALVGAAARRTGLVADNRYAERLAGMGITEQQAQAGYSLISENLGATQRLGEFYGDRYGQRDFESEVFEGDGDSTRKRKRLASQERAAFSGSSGIQRGSLNQSSTGQY